MNSKHKVPELYKGVLIREKLLKELDSSSGGAFFISAGKGLGKTTLLCLYAKMKKNVFWYTADGSDNDIKSFCNNFIEPFRGEVPEEAANSVLDPFWVINSIGNRDISIIIDNFESIKNERIIEFFRDFMLFRPKYTKVIIASRNIMPVSFTELILKGKITGIENDDIAFSAKEAEKAFGVSNIESYIKSDGIPEILGSGTENAPAEYYEGILRGLDEKLRSFICKTVFLVDIYPEICRNALGINDAEALIRLAEGINPVSYIGREGLCYSHGFTVYCSYAYAETGLRVRRSAFDYCAKNGKIKEAVIYSALTGDFDNIPVVLRNNCERFFEELKCSDADFLIDLTDSDYDIYCCYVKSVCQYKMGLFKEALESAVRVCDGANRIDSRIDKAAFLLLKAKTENSLFNRGKEYISLTEAADILKSYNADMSVKISAARVRSLLFSGSRSEAISLCRENISSSYANGKYCYMNIFRLNMCLCRLVNNEPDKAEDEYRSIDFKCIENYGDIGVVSAVTAIFFHMAGMEDNAFELINNSFVFNISSSEGKEIIDWTRRIMLIKTYIRRIAEGEPADKDCICDVLDLNGRSGESSIRELKVVSLIFKRLIISVFDSDLESIKKGMGYLSEYYYGTAGYIAGECMSAVLAMLIVLKKDKIAAEAVNSVFIYYKEYNGYPMEILPLIIYIKSKNGEDISSWAEKYIKAAVNAGRAATYPIGFINRPLIEYLDRTGKYGDIIDEIVKLTGVSERVKICTFGELDINGTAVSGDMIKWRTAKTKELFAYFVHKGGGPVAKADIVKDVFDVDDDKKATEIFNTTMYNLRKTVKKVFSDNLFSLSKGRYSMDLSGVFVDAAQFREMIEKFNESHSLSSASRMVELYKGEYMKGINASWKGDAAQRYEEAFCDAAEVYINSLADNGNLDAAAEAGFIIWNEKCRSDRIRDFLTGFFRKYGIKAELK